jgi:14-3-3 protein
MNLTNAITELIQLGVSLTDEERSLFTISLKERMKQLRVSYLGVAEMEAKIVSSPSSANASSSVDKVSLVKQYKDKLGNEIVQLSDEGIRVINRYIMVSINDQVGKNKSEAPSSIQQYLTIYFYKLQADLYRYKAEVTIGAEHEKNVEDALYYYKNSSDIALTSLPASSPLRLSLALAFSVFYYEQLASPERACLIAKGAFDDAVIEMDKGGVLRNEEEMEESSILLGLVRENLEMWCGKMVGDVMS